MVVSALLVLSQSVSPEMCFGSWDVELFSTGRGSFTTLLSSGEGLPGSSDPTPPLSRRRTLTRTSGTRVIPDRTYALPYVSGPTDGGDGWPVEGGQREEETNKKQVNP